MLKLHCSGLWDVIRKLAGSNAHRYAAVAYVTDDSVLQFGEGDALIVDASRGAIANGLTSARLLMKAFRNGAEVFSHPSLHAKIMVFDRTAVIGSANISQSSMDRLLEAAVVTDDPSLVSAANNILAKLKLKSRKVDEKTLRALLSIRVVRHGFLNGRSKRRPPVIEPTEGNTWLVGTFDLDTRRFKDEELRAERGHNKAREEVLRQSSDVEWIRFPKKSSFAHKASEGDWLIQMYGRRLGESVVKVYRRAPILRIQKETNCVRIYVEDFKNADAEALKWRTFCKIARQSGIPERHMGRRSRGLLTDSQADALESFWKLELSRNRQKKR